MKCGPTIPINNHGQRIRNGIEPKLNRPRTLDNMPIERNGRTSEYSELDGMFGVDEAIEVQKDKLKALREQVRKLAFRKIDMAGSYSSITYKAFDGGKMGIRFIPFEINVVDVADSNGKRRVRFVVPEISGFENDNEVREDVLDELDKIPEIKKLYTLLGQKSIRDISHLLIDSNNLMEISEWACIFDRLTADNQEPIIILKDGLLRTKVIKADGKNNYVRALREIVKQNKENAKLVGVSKTSNIVSLLSTALFLEKKIPPDSIGFVKIPLELELKAYQWTGKGSARVDTKNPNPLYYAFGELYIAKLAKNSNLLVTIEVPKDLESGEGIYSEEEINDILSHLAKDSKYSYPVIGYPQTIMRAHETAVRLGFPASILRDELRDKIFESLGDKDAKEFIRDAWLLMDTVDKGVLGGGQSG